MLLVSPPAGGLAPACGWSLRCTGRPLRASRDLRSMVLEIVPQPIDKAVRLARNAACHLVDAYELDIGHFGRIWLRLRSQRSEIDIDVFIFLHAAVEVGAVAAVKSEGERCSDAELFGEPSPGRHQRGLARTRMPAAGIRQQSSGMIFLPAAPLQQDAALVVDD